MSPKLRGYWQRRGWKDLLFLCLLLAFAGIARHYLFPPPLTDYQKWQRRPALQIPANNASPQSGQGGLPPCLFLAPSGGPAQSVTSGSIGDCLLLVPDGTVRNLFEVNLRTGNFIPVKTDAHVDDTILLAFTRVYLPIDEPARRTQIYLRDVYDPFLLGSRFPYTYVEWNLPDLQIIHYDRVSPGTGYADAVFEHSANTPLFGWSRIAWNSFGWDLNRADGMTYLTPEAYYSTRPVQSSLVAIFDPNGHQARLTRQANGDLTEIKSPNGYWIRLSYSEGHISRVKSSAAEQVEYEYDADNRLHRAGNAHGYEEYSFDASNRIRTITHSASGLILQITYDSLGRVIEQVLEGKAIYHIHYLTDAAGNIVGAEVIGPQSQVARITFHDENYSIEKME
jgi:hypothetical protein